MSLDQVTPGKNVPDAFNVIIEIPMNADPVKYEVDKETGAIFVDRFMSTAMHYPTNYGYVPKTISGDGDPVDVLVITPVPLIPGVVVPCRPIGILKMQDEAGEDAKVLAVPIDKILGPKETRGADVGGGRVHSIRLPSYVLAVETIFGMNGERLQIRHEAGTSAEPYVGGTLLAARRVVVLKGLVRGLDNLLFGALPAEAKKA